MPRPDDSGVFRRLTWPTLASIVAVLLGVLALARIGYAVAAAGDLTGANANRIDTVAQEQKATEARVSRFEAATAAVAERSKHVDRQFLDIKQNLRDMRDEQHNQAQDIKAELRLLRQQMEGPR